MAVWIQLCRRLNKLKFPVSMNILALRLGHKFGVKADCVAERGADDAPINLIEKRGLDEGVRLEHGGERWW